MDNTIKQDILNMLMDIPYAKYDRRRQVRARSGAGAGQSSGNGCLSG